MVIISEKQDGGLKWVSYLAPRWVYLCEVWDLIGVTVDHWVLKGKSYSIGTSTKNNIVITKAQLEDDSSYNELDRQQFKIKKKDEAVYLKNGTKKDMYINGEKKLSAGNKEEIKHNDIISVLRPRLKMFVYLDNGAVEAASYPDDIKERYVVSSLIGRGAFGEVSLIFEKKSCRKYAMKKISKKSSFLKYTDLEVKILREVNHPLIIHMEYIRDTPETLYIVMDFIEGGDLNSRLQPVLTLTESRTKLIFYQLALAVQYLHDKRIAHRDLKPLNILLTSDRPECLIKVTDFGVSKIEANTWLRTQIGSRLYNAPEVLNAHNEPYTNKVDVWSMGVILFYCLNGCLPFQFIDEILRGEYKFKPMVLRRISPLASELVRKMLVVDPTKRIDINEIISQPWLQDEVMKNKLSNLLAAEAQRQQQPPTVLQVNRPGPAIRSVPDKSKPASPAGKIKPPLLDGKGMQDLITNSAPKDVRGNISAKDIKINSPAHDIKLNNQVQVIRRNSPAQDVIKNDILKNRRNSGAKDVRRNSAAQDIIKNEIVQDLRRNSGAKDVGRNSAAQDIVKNEIVQDIRRNSASKDSERNSAEQDVIKNGIEKDVKRNGIVQNVKRNSIVQNVRRNSAVPNDQVDVPNQLQLRRFFSERRPGEPRGVFRIMNRSMKKT
uniref:non-specific serine/threonine protein kinase n=1 Tax=Timema californicum TaxID=61474 RepID=A0A7R9JD58_TIMCA|nr:unnamed protein product [Timema californicum]